MVREDYHEYGWYLDGKEVECCASPAEPVQVGRKDLESILAYIAEAEPHLAERHAFQRLRAALEGK
jgi:hypothetical protein